MELDTSAAPEAIDPEPVVKKEFTSSFAPWNQFAPGELVLDSSDETDSLDDQQPQNLASSAFSKDPPPETNRNTHDTASGNISSTCRLTIKEEIDAFSQMVTSRLKTVKTTLKDRQDSVPTIIDQLPTLDITQEESIWNDPSIPMLLPEVLYHIRYWRVALFAVCAHSTMLVGRIRSLTIQGIFVYVDETAAKCLDTLAPDIPYQLLEPQLLDLSSLVSLLFLNASLVGMLI